MRITDSTRLDRQPDVSADGRDLAFISERSGEFEVWKSQAVGSNAVRLTHFGGPETTGPKWSADGKWIAFCVWLKGKARGFVVPSDGGEPRELESGVPVGWSHDGRMMYLTTSDRAGTIIRSVSVRGGKGKTILRDVGRFFETSAGYFFQRGDGIWRKRGEGGTEQLLTKAVTNGLWASAGNGICYMRKDGARHIVNCVDGGGKVTQLADLGSWPGIYGPAGFAVSPNARWLFYERVDQVNSEVMVASTGGSEQIRLRTFKRTWRYSGAAFLLS